MEKFLESRTFTHSTSFVDIVHAQCLKMLTPQSQLLGWWYIAKDVLNPVKSSSNQSTSTFLNESEAMNLVLDIDNSLSKMCTNYMNVRRSRVNYRGLRDSAEFQDYVKLIDQLHKIDLANTLKDDFHRKSFFINLYNGLAIHGIVLGKFEQSGWNALNNWAMQNYCAAISYQIGPHIYSLNDIHHGVLRNNSVLPVALGSPPFRDVNDARLPFVLPLDPRIHFGLNFGSISCPPIHVYSLDHERLENQLKAATQHHLDEYVVLDKQNGSMSLHPLFNWYLEDFGGNYERMLQWIRCHMREDKREEFDEFLLQWGLPTIEFQSFDWTLNDII